LFGSLLVGANAMQRAVQVPSALIDTLLGVVVLVVVGADYTIRRRAARRNAALTAANNAGPQAELEAGHA